MSSFKEFMAATRGGEVAEKRLALRSSMVAGESQPPWGPTVSESEETTVARRRGTAAPRDPSRPKGPPEEDAVSARRTKEQDAFEKKASLVNCCTSRRCRVNVQRHTATMPRWKVSILCPTTPKRRKFHELLVDNWKSQTYPDCDLVVYDTGPGGPSEALEKSGCDYTYVAGCKMSLGEKRQWTTDRATGDVCVLFDDDNIYAPEYVSTMVEHLFRSGAELIAIKGWLELHAISKKLFRIEPNRDAPGAARNACPRPTC